MGVRPPLETIMLFAAIAAAAPVLANLLEALPVSER
jgi:hypothetical protein